MSDMRIPSVLPVLHLQILYEKHVLSLVRVALFDKQTRRLSIRAVAYCRPLFNVPA